MTTKGGSPGKLKELRREESAFSGSKREGGGRLARRLPAASGAPGVSDGATPLQPQPFLLLGDLVSAVLHQRLQRLVLLPELAHLPFERSSAKRVAFGPVNAGPRHRYERGGPSARPRRLSNGSSAPASEDALRREQRPQRRRVNRQAAGGRSAHVIWKRRSRSRSSWLRRAISHRCGAPSLNRPSRSRR